LVTVDAVATVAPKMSPAVTVVVQPEMEPFWFSCELDRVTGADALIFWALVGIAAARFQISTVIDPD
jgi:hypothetical protein